MKSTHKSLKFKTPSNPKSNSHHDTVSGVSLNLGASEKEDKLFENF
ncbi:MAG: hypothetical protein HC830_10475 [Bacteroidetes bacterium]|nr:hypothetical protein [Bacteroidota bacterium]